VLVALVVEMDIGKMIKEMRRERGITQSELARFAGVSFSTINRIEKGEKNITLKTVNSVLNVFGYDAGAVKKEYKVESEETFGEA
jgi:y4mF family transcriptional regulator